MAGISSTLKGALLIPAVSRSIQKSANPRELAGKKFALQWVPPAGGPRGNRDAPRPGPVMANGNQKPPRDGQPSIRHWHSASLRPRAGAAGLRLGLGLELAATEWPVRDGRSGLSGSG